MKHPFLISCTLAMVLALSGTTTMAAGHADKTFGEAGQAIDATRTITIDAGTKYVDVKTGETINFNIGDKSFTWNFDGTTGRSKFGMDKIAPPRLLTHKVMIYIDRVPPNPS